MCARGTFCLFFLSLYLSLFLYQPPIPGSDGGFSNPRATNSFPASKKAATIRIRTWAKGSRAGALRIPISASRGCMTCPSITSLSRKKAEISDSKNGKPTKGKVFRGVPDFHLLGFSVCEEGIEWGVRSSHFIRLALSYILCTHFHAVV